MGDATDRKEMRRTFTVPVIKPFYLYDFIRAKIACNLGWLMAKAFGRENIPDNIKDPFFTEQFDQEDIKPLILNLLLSGELYRRAGSPIFKSSTATTQRGHGAIICALAQKGLYIRDHKRLITKRDLCKIPIRMSAHLAMIDTLMMAYTAEMVNIKKVIACAQQYSKFFQDTDLPSDIESAVMYWIHKVNEHLKDIMEQEQKSKEHPTAEAPRGQKAPHRKEQILLKHLSCIRLVENLLKDGCALAALIHFYCPSVVQFEDIRLNGTMSLADSVHNLQLIREFCKEYLNHCCHFSLEDMLYASPSIKSNCLVFMAELFWCFEVVKPSFVQPRVVCPQGVEHGKDVPSVPVLNASTRSIMDSSFSSDFTSRYDCLQAHSSISEGITPSSMSYVESIIGKQSKKKRVYHISFDISFHEENNTENSTPHQRIICCIRNKGLTLNNSHASKHNRSKLSSKPVGGEGIEEELDPCGDLKFYISLDTNELISKENTHYKLSNEALQITALLDEFVKQIDTQSIEEALQIIHVTENSSNTPGPDKITNDFSPYSQDLSILNSDIKLNHLSPDNIRDTNGVLSPITDPVEVDTGIHVRSEDIQKTMDKDSSLRDYTIRLETRMDDASKSHWVFDVRIRHPTEAPSPCPHTISTKAEPRCSASSRYEGNMARFAKQNFRELNHTDWSSSQNTEPESFELNSPCLFSSRQMPEETRTSQRQDRTQPLDSQMMQLKVRLEEMRCDIGAYKKKMKAHFTKERLERKGEACLTAVKKKEDGIPPLQEKAADADDDKMYRAQEKERESQKNDRQNNKSLPDMKESMENPQGKRLKSPTMPVDPKKQGNLAITSADIYNERENLKYMKSIEKLGSSLHFLQEERKRLTLKHEMLVKMRRQRSWVTSPPQPSPQKQIQDFKSRQEGLSAASAPFSSHSPRSTYPSPQSSKRKHTIFSGKSQRNPRPNELNITPSIRTLTPPESVDILPPLRKFSSSQVPTQTRSFLPFDNDGEHQLKDPKPKEEIKKESFDSKGTLEPCDHNPRGKEIIHLESTISKVLSQPTVCVTPNEAKSN